MGHPSHSPYPPHNPYATAGGPQRPRRNTALLGGIVIACTALVLGSILLVAFVVNRGGDDSAADEGGDEATAGEAADETADNDPEEVAVTVVKIMFGQSDQTSEGLVCADPGTYLADVDTTGGTVADMFGEMSDLVDDFAAGDATETDEGISVTVSMVMSGVESPFATVDLVVEDGSWKACDLSF